MISLLFILLFSFSSLGLSEEIILKTGETVNGKIIKQGEDYITVDLGIGVNVTYFLNEVDKIDGKTRTFPSSSSMVNTGSSIIEKPVMTDEYQTNLSLGEKLFKQTQFKQALQYFEKCIEINPRKPEGYFFAGSANMRLDNNDKALELLKKGLEVSPDDFDINFKLSEVYDLLEDPDTALNYALKACEILPSGVSYLRAGVLYSKLQKNDLAKEMFKKSMVFFKKEENKDGYQLATDLYDRH